MESDKRMQNPELDNTINIWFEGKGKQIKRIYFSGYKNVPFLLKILTAYTLIPLPHQSSSSIKYLQTCNQWSNMWWKFWDLSKSLVNLTEVKRHKGRGNLISLCGRHPPSAYLAWRDTCEVMLLSDSAASPRMIDSYNSLSILFTTVRPAPTTVYLAYSKCLALTRIC